MATPIYYILSFPPSLSLLTVLLHTAIMHRSTRASRQSQASPHTPTPAPTLSSRARGKQPVRPTETPSSTSSSSTFSQSSLAMWRLSQPSQLSSSPLSNPPDLYEPADDDVVGLQQHLDEGITGIHFDVDFHNVWQNGQRLTASRLGYMVLHKSYLNGGRKGSRI